MSPTMFALLVGGAIIALAAALIIIVFTAARQTNVGRMQRRLSGVDHDVGAYSDTENSGFLAWLAGPGRIIDGWIDEGETNKLLAQAGWRTARASAAYFSFQALLPLLTVSATAFIWAFGSDDGQHGPIVLMWAFIAISVGLLGPRWILRSRAERRRAVIKDEVPLFIHVLILLFEAGLSTRQAIASLVREGAGVLPHLGKEFEAVMRKLDAGGDTGDVLKAMGEQLDVSELAGILSVIRQVERFGGEVREPLTEALHVLEERRSLDLRERVNLLSGRMTVVMVGFFFPALLIFVAGPAFVSIIKALGDINK